MSNGLLNSTIGGGALGLGISQDEYYRRQQYDKLAQITKEQQLAMIQSGSALTSSGYAAAARIDTNRTLFDVEKIENGYMMYVGNKKYFAESRNALGELMVVLLTQKENANGHD